MMTTETHTLSHGSPGRSHTLAVHRFGAGLSGPKLYVQAGLHADEAPGMLVVQVLMAELQRLQSQGDLLGEVVVVPMANPIGLGQSIQGQAFGRFALSDGLNFNRCFAHLSERAADRLRQSSALGTDAETNAQALRVALSQACEAIEPQNETESLRKLLMQLAIPCATVIDLHCDGESVVHLYAGTPLAQACKPLAQAMGAHALLTAEVSGDNPFDEALSRPWWEVPQALSTHPFPPAHVHGLAATVELRGEGDVRDDLASQDAQALLAFAAVRGVVKASAVTATNPVAHSPAPTPLAGVEPLLAPISGVIVFEREPGTQVQAGERVARVLNPATGEQRDVRATRAGVLYARVAQRTTWAGRRVAKVAGREAFRSGALLSP
jgi:uncharacterized protein